MVERPGRTSRGVATNDWEGETDQPTAGPAPEGDDQAIGWM